MTLKQILLPTGFSGTAAHALGYARGMAERFATEVNMLYVMPDPPPRAPRIRGFREVARRSRQKQERWCCSLAIA